MTTTRKSIEQRFGRPVHSDIDGCRPYDPRFKERYYVYVGPAVSMWINYDDLNEARQNHPDEIIFDRITKRPIV